MEYKGVKIKESNVFAYAHLINGAHVHAICLRAQTLKLVNQSP